MTMSGWWSSRFYYLAVVQRARDKIHLISRTDHRNNESKRKLIWLLCLCSWTGSMVGHDEQRRNLIRGCQMQINYKTTSPWDSRASSSSTVVSWGGLILLSLLCPSHTNSTHHQKRQRDGWGTLLETKRHRQAISNDLIEMF